MKLQLNLKSLAITFCLFFNNDRDKILFSLCVKTNISYVKGYYFFKL